MSWRLVLYFLLKNNWNFADLDVPVIAQVKKADIINFVGEENDVAIKSAEHAYWTVPHNLVGQETNAVTFRSKEREKVLRTMNLANALFCKATPIDRLILVINIIILSIMWNSN
jgi:hypothetical protein